MCILKTSENLCYKGFISYPETKIYENQFTFITGESGCGKSSFLKLLNASSIPTSGTVFYEEKNIQDLEILDYRKTVLLVPHEVFLFDGTILDNFNTYRRYSQRTPLRATEAEKFLNICCADFSPSSSCQTLSGGEKQRVFLSIFLSCMPKVILLDEPTAALDEKTSINLMTNLKKFCQDEKITAVVVCHNNDLVNKFADNVIRFGKEGKL